jgi:phenylpropionate dioxygenase-like ring-hydroxylating dioxygenase large terminal subunit
MFLRNCWYMTGWSTDFAADAIVACTLLGEAIVVYRKADGVLAALEDRCCHRLAPLSVGRREGDDIRCMYHGLKFAPDGRCVEIPGQDRVPSSIRVRSYPIVEKHGGAWIWMGAPERADEALIPPISGPDDPEWALVSSHLDIEASAGLVCDNLLDLSHAPFVHANSFGAGDQKVLKVMTRAESSPQLTELERGVHIERWHLNRASNPYNGAQPSDDWVVNEFLAPGVFILRTRCYTQGVTQRTGEGKPTEEPILARCTCQMVTPLTARKTRLFFNFGPWAKEAENRNTYFKIGAAAFCEDKAMIEAQQGSIDRSPGRSMRMLAMDRPVARYNEILKRLLTADQAASAHS